MFLTFCSLLYEQQHDASDFHDASSDRGNGKIPMDTKRPGYLSFLLLVHRACPPARMGVEVERIEQCLDGSPLNDLQVCVITNAVLINKNC